MAAMQWGIIGPGNIAHKFIKDLALLDPPQLVKAVMGQTKEKTDEFARQYYIPYSFTDLDEFIEKGRPDIVYISTPHPFHYQQALSCLTNKIAVLCEKPLTINEKQCRHLITASRRHNVFLMEAMWIRFLPGIRKVLDIINKGLIGRIKSIHASISFKAPVGDNRYFDPELGGGSLLDLGVYPVFLSMLLLGRPQTIKAKGQLTGQGVDKSCSILFNYSSGAYSQLESSFMTQDNRPAIITGEKGVIKILDPWFEKSPGVELRLYDKQKKTVYKSHWEGHGFQFEAAEAIKCISAKKIYSPLLPHELTLATIETMDEIRRHIHVAYEIYE